MRDFELYHNRRFLIELFSFWTKNNDKKRKLPGSIALENPTGLFAGMGKMPFFKNYVYQEEEKHIYLIPAVSW